MKKIILASTSPRRREILKNAGFIFECISPKYDESLINKTFSYKKIEDLAEKKCDSIVKEIEENAIVISADTVVIYDNIVMGKPKDHSEAFSMLKTLNGKTHKVVTAICLYDSEKNKKIIKTQTSEVTFNKVSDDEIEDYINQYKPYDKAGSYGIQELKKSFVANIKGEYDNIVGLPLKTLTKMLEEITK